MKNILIFCEGVTDQIFISDCIELFLGESVQRISKNNNSVEITFGENCKIIPTYGCRYLQNPVIINMIKDNSELGGKSVVILDADKLGNGNNGFLSATQKLDNLRTAHAVEFDHYLWHNNSSDGTLEDLLTQLIPNHRTEVWKCMLTHKSCIENLLSTGVRNLEYKELINFYLHSHDQKPRGVERNYKDINFWDLQIKECADLTCFKNFLIEKFGLT